MKLYLLQFGQPAWTLMNEPITREIFLKTTFPLSSTVTKHARATP